VSDVLVLNEAEVERAVSMGEAIDALEGAFREYGSGDAIVPPRLGITIPGGGGAFRMMSAVLPSTGLFGMKTLTGYPGRRRDGETYFVVLLFSMTDGALRAIIPANYLTGLRTGAASGLAARYLARPAASTVGILGAGVQGWFQIVALNQVRPLTEVRVFGRDAARAGAFASRIEQVLGIRAHAVNDAREAVSGCDLVVTATSSGTPVIEATWLDPGTHISGVGANTPAKRELDPATFSRSLIVVDYLEQALEEAGDLRDAISTGAIAGSDVAIDLAGLVSGTCAGRTSADQITLFKSVGMAIQDIATAAVVYRRAAELGLGRAMSFATVS
jgi:alanine dehydrogenase